MRIDAGGKAIARWHLLFRAVTIKAAIAISNRMTFDLQRMLESKRVFRQKLAARPVAEKLRLLDELRERALVIRRSSTAARESGMVAALPAEYRTDPK